MRSRRAQRAEDAASKVALALGLGLGWLVVGLFALGVAIAVGAILLRVFFG